ncbi:hypothetical protein LOK49_LG10G01574 [Camellia lanceoleosa]|uniref:Uncharacterized protein n=1 Tax=Camellia lanceoleosa TaxID=1840588 RepID=A0ACC0GCZ6_9ERIC|nr:hypothetical protein LOK49_LG10G01574 [Camellia lanceoleosa]
MHDLEGDLSYLSRSTLQYEVQQKIETNPLSVLRQAIRRVTPDIAEKARRVSGLTYQALIEIGSTQEKALAIR